MTASADSGSGARATDGRTDRLVIDAHTHVYPLDEERYPPVAGAFRPPGDSGTVEALLRQMDADGVHAACAIHTISFHGWDNRFLCDLAAAHAPRIAGICVVHPERQEGPAFLRQLAETYGIRGLRSVPTYHGQYDHPGVVALWEAAADAGLVVSALVGRENADALAWLLRRFPSVPVVVEHALSIDGSADRADTVRRLLELTAFENVHVELCDLPLLSADGPPYADAHDVYRRIVDAFGAERCVWGSGFPPELWLPGHTYADHLRAVSEALALGDVERDAILGGTAAGLWFRHLDRDVLLGLVRGTA